MTLFGWRDPLTQAQDRAPLVLNDAPSYDAPEPPPEPVNDPDHPPEPKPKRAPRKLSTPETVLYRHVPTRYSPTGCYGFGFKTTSKAADNDGTLPQGYRLQNTSDKTRGKVGMCNCDPAERFTIATRHDNQRIVGVFRGARHHDVAAEVAERLNRMIQTGIRPDANCTDGEHLTNEEIQLAMRGAANQTNFQHTALMNGQLPAEWLWAEEWGLLK